jgi:hypothetical protein
MSRIKRLRDGAFVTKHDAAVAMEYEHVKIPLFVLLTTFNLLRVDESLPSTPSDQETLSEVYAEPSIPSGPASR